MKKVDVFQHVSWASRWTFIMAATSSAAGLGNIWKFPYIAGVYGGGAFVLMYLLCIAIVGVPIMIAEMLLGRSSKTDPISTMRKLAVDSDTSKAWMLVGIAGVITGVMIMMFYSVVAGWALDYVWQCASGAISHTDGATSQTSFEALRGDFSRQMITHTLFSLLTAGIVAFGVTKGIGGASRVLTPMLLAIVLLLVGYAALKGEFSKGLEFLLYPDFSKLSAKAVLVAMGHSFFTLSLGMGAIMVYGSYMPDNVSISKTVITVALLDTGVALAAGAAIFPLVFAHEALQPGAGPGLMFVTLPTAFGDMPGGMLFGTLFFVLVGIAALTSSISLIEPGVAWLERMGVNRIVATAGLTLTAWIGGVFCIRDGAVFDTLDYITTNIMLPLGGLATAIFTGWFLKKKFARTQMSDLSLNLFNFWYATIRVFTPLAVIAVFLYQIGVLEKIGLITP